MSLVIIALFVIFVVHYLHRRHTFIQLYKKTLPILESMKQDHIAKRGDSAAMRLEDQLKSWRKSGVNSHMRRYNEMCDLILAASGENTEKKLKVLDIGCGDAYFYSVFAKKADMEQFQLYGLDISNARLILAKQRLKDHENIEFHFGNAEKIDFDDNEFDIVVSIESLEHLITPQNAVDEMNRVLKPGGSLFLSTPSKHMAFFTYFNPLTWVEALISLFYSSILPPFHNLYRPETDGEDAVVHRAFTKNEMINMFNGWFDVKMKTSDFPFDEFLPGKAANIEHFIFSSVKPLNGLGRRFIISAKK